MKVFSLKAVLKFAGLFAGVLLISAVLAPLLFKILPFKFERIFDRLVMIQVLILVVCYVRIRRETLEKFGIIWSQSSPRLFSIGFIAALVTLGGWMAVRLIFGNVSFQLADLSAWEWVERSVKIVLSCVVIAVIEEFFFRGYVYSEFRYRFRWPLALSLIVTNIFYSLVHFLDGERPFISDNPTFFDSLKLMQAPFNALLQWEHVLPGAIGLFIFGLILSMLCLRTGSLYPAMGLHAGGVFFVKFDGSFFQFLDEKPLIFGSTGVLDGILGWVALGILALVFHLFIFKKNQMKEAGSQ